MAGPFEELVEPYLWLVVVGCFFGFMYAFGIGANDVANAFATTVASKSLTLMQAVIAASIFEFCGAYFLGASVTSTIRSKIFDIKLYEDQPDVLMLGMFTTLLTAMVMLLTATSYELPVSTTHTVVGCMMGFSIAAQGFDSIEWPVVIQILISWLASPLVSGLMAFIFFGSIRRWILLKENSFDRAHIAFPFILTVGIGINIFYVLNKGASNRFPILKEEFGLCAGIGFGSGALCGLVWYFIIGPIAKKKVLALMAAKEEATAEKAATLQEEPQAPAPPKAIKSSEVFADSIKTDAEAVDMKPTEDEADLKAEPKKEIEETEEVTGWRKWQKEFKDNTYGQDLEAISLEENAGAADIWDHGEVYDPATEHLFKYLQVFTACLNSFAHGANDVANAMAPISALVTIYQSGGEVESKSPVAKWILAYGGVGIVVGLLLYGYRVMKSLGYKMTILSPSRGSCAELAAAFFVLTASFMGIPVSSTQCICGAVVGVGLCGGKDNVQWSFFARICMGWVIIFFSSIIISCGVFAMFAFTPSLSQPRVEVEL